MSRKGQPWSLKRRLASGFLDPETRFWSKVQKTEGCWIWTGGKDNKGYGRFSVSGHFWPAHRWLYERLHGVVLKTQEICHTCDNPGCVNPDHLFSGTKSDNMIDCTLKGRLPRAKLSAIQAKEIFASALPTRDLAAKYAVNRATIQRIRNGTLWKTVGVQS